MGAGRESNCWRLSLVRQFSSCRNLDLWRGCREDFCWKTKAREFLDREVIRSPPQMRSVRYQDANGRSPEGRGHRRSRRHWAVRRRHPRSTTVTDRARRRVAFPLASGWENSLHCMSRPLGLGLGRYLLERLQTLHSVHIQMDFPTFTDSWRMHRRS